jgi:hypothetical protein
MMELSYESDNSLNNNESKNGNNRNQIMKKYQYNKALSSLKHRPATSCVTNKIIITGSLL